MRVLRPHWRWHPDTENFHGYAAQLASGIWSCGSSSLFSRVCPLMRRAFMKGRGRASQVRVIPHNLMARSM